MRTGARRRVLATAAMGGVDMATETDIDLANERIDDLRTEIADLERDIAAERRDNEKLRAALESIADDAKDALR